MRSSQSNNLLWAVHSNSISISSSSIHLWVGTKLLLMIQLWKYEIVTNSYLKGLNITPAPNDLLLIWPLWWSTLLLCYFNMCLKVTQCSTASTLESYLVSVVQKHISPLLHISSKKSVYWHSQLEPNYTEEKAWWEEKELMPSKGCPLGKGSWGWWLLVETEYPPNTSPEKGQAGSYYLPFLWRVLYSEP